MILILSHRPVWLRHVGFSDNVPFLCFMHSSSRCFRSRVTKLCSLISPLRNSLLPHYVNPTESLSSSAPVINERNSHWVNRVWSFWKNTRHDDVIKWKHFPRYWPFVRGIQRSPVNSPHKGQWRGALMFSLICVWINGWVNNREAGDLRCYRAHYDVIVMNIETGVVSLVTPIPDLWVAWAVI